MSFDNKLLRRCAIAVIACDGLAAYSIGNIPLPWISEAFLLSLVVILLAAGYVRAPKALLSFGIFFLWMLIVSLAFAGNEYSDLQPIHATTGYAAYISLRFLNMFAFAGMAVITYNLLKKDEP